MSNILRIIIFQSLWFAFIKFGYHEHSYLFPLIALVITSIDKKIFYNEITWKKFFIFSFTILGYGIISDSILLNLNLISFNNWGDRYTPLYFWAIWLIFIPYYDMAFYKFKNKKYLSIFIAAIFAPIAYKGGSELGSLNEISFSGLIGISVSWMIFMPLSVYVYTNYIDSGQLNCDL